MTASTPAAGVATFVDRHIGPDAADIATMLQVIGVSSLEELAAKALPAGILDAVSADGLAPGLDELARPATEHQALAELRAGSTWKCAGLNAVKGHDERYAGRPAGAGSRTGRDRRRQILPRGVAAVGPRLP